jgi:glycosyltransferase involved in cell wall biosynthesis
VLTLHSGLAPPYIRAHARWVRRICRRYTTVIAVNREIAAAVTDAGVPAAQVVIAPAFTTASLQFRLPPPGLAAIRRRHPLLLSSAIVHGAPEYGEDVLLDAFLHVHKTFEAAALLVYGPGTRAATFVAEVRRRGLAGSVYCMGELARERALALVAASDVFVRPSRADGDAISVREALALERPVVASDVGTRPPEAHLFDAGNPHALAEQIFHVVGKPSTRHVRSSATLIDSLPAILAIYARCGLPVGETTLSETSGTGLATDVA